MVSRVTLNGMNQDREEGIRSFVVRLRGQANICHFAVNCGHDPTEAVDYTDHMVGDNVIRGIADAKIQQDILGHENQDMELEALLKVIEAKEATAPSFRLSSLRQLK